VVVRPIKPLHSLLLAAALVYGAANAADVRRIYAIRAQLAADLRTRKEIGALLPPDGYVVATIHNMPLFQRDALYQNATSYAPNGFDGARVMQELNVDPYSKEFTTERAFERLEARKPALIMLDSNLAPYARTAVDQYVAKHDAEYTRMDGRFGPMLIRKR
jgi:hypothetical protein